MPSNEDAEEAARDTVAHLGWEAGQAEVLGRPSSAKRMWSLVLRTIRVEQARMRARGYFADDIEREVRSLERLAERSRRQGAFVASRSGRAKIPS